MLLRPQALFFGGLTTLTTLLTASPLLHAAPTVELEVDPPLSEVIPFSKVANLTITARDELGHPLENANLRLQLNTPPKSPWLTSDFPIVEGTTLLDLALPTVEGAVELQQMMPIRGTYTLTVTVSPQVPEQFETFTEVIQFKVPENPIKYRNLAQLIGLLLLIGFGGGWVIGGNQTTLAGEVAPRRIQLLLSSAILITIGILLYVSISAEQADAHPDGQDYRQDNASPAIPEAEAIPETLTPQLTFRGEPTVGYPTPFTFNVSNAKGQPLSNARLEIQSYSLEYDRLVLAFTAETNAAGDYTWSQQFFDGAPHAVVVNVLPPQGLEDAFEPFKIRESVEVIGVTPPLSVRLITLGYFVTALGIGTGSGFMLRRYQRSE